MSVIQLSEVCLQGVQGFQDNTGLTWLNVGGKPSIILVIMICMFACFVHKKQLPPVTKLSQIKILVLFLLVEKRVFTEMTDENHSDDSHVAYV